MPRLKSSLAPSSSCGLYWLNWIGSHRELWFLEPFHGVNDRDLLECCAYGGSPFQGVSPLRHVSPFRDRAYF